MRMKLNKKTLIIKSMRMELKKKKTHKNRIAIRESKWEENLCTN
jgi:hypothetical protein